MWIPIYRAKAYRHFGSFFSKVDGKSIPGGVFNYRGIVSCTLTMSESSSSPGKEKIVVMKDGIVQQVDTPQNLYENPVNEFVAGFMGSPQMNFLDAVLSREGNQYSLTFGECTVKIPQSKTEGASLDDYVGKSVTFGIRPEDVHDEPDFLAKAQDSTAKANVEVTELMGSETYLYLSCEGNPITARVEPTSTAKSGDNIAIALDMSKCHIFDKETEKAVLN